MNLNSEWTELTSRGLMLLRRLGNGSPTLSQMGFAQSIVSLLSKESAINTQFNELLNNDTQSRESIQRDNLFLRRFEENAGFAE